MKSETNNKKGGKNKVANSFSKIEKYINQFLLVLSLG